LLPVVVDDNYKPILMLDSNRT